MHYKRWRLYGDVNANMRIDRDPADRFWPRVAGTDPLGCWRWAGKVNNNGYGTIAIGRRVIGERRTVIAHRFAYEYLVAPIPDGLQLDHLCRNRLCVNPWHLDPVTPAINTRRGGPAMSSTCRRGHEFTPENTYRQPSTGRRSCKVCRADAAARARKQVAA